MCRPLAHQQKRCLLDGHVAGTGKNGVVAFAGVGQNFSISGGTEKTTGEGGGYVRRANMSGRYSEPWVLGGERVCDCRYGGAVLDRRRLRRAE
ncbi:unnamed protein product [Macrosiphum euphorbiae]|uniref:Uncharacterized protein n=1 Tax=Macrosiphum euphorbiae TaxID=13131 RepID=A0AAV0XUJ6_9HEMI|nr:unnamed protein product [Macrosiphum euphorbiae]